MPKFPYKQMGVEINRNFRNDLNQNLKDIESDIKELGQSHLTALAAADEAKKQANIAKTEAAKATVETERLNNVDAAQFDARLTEVSEQLAQKDRKTVTIGHGTNVVNADVSSPVNVEIYGRTLVNEIQPKVATFAEDSNGDGVADGWEYSFSTGSPTPNVITDSRFGNAQKITNNNSTGPRIFRIIPLDPSKYYIVGIWAKSVGDRGRVYIGDGADWYDTKYGSKTINGNSYNFHYAKIANTSKCNLTVSINNGSNTDEVVFSGATIYSISSDTYDKIGVSLTDADVEKMFPYVDSVQHLTNPMITVEGGNLAPYPNDENYNKGDGTYQKLNTWIDGKLHVTSGGSVVHGRGIIIDVIPGQQYTLSFKSEVANDGNLPRIRMGYSSIGEEITSEKTSSPYTFIPERDKVYIKFLRRTGSDSNNPVKFWDIMLTPGNNERPYSPRNPSYLYADVKLGKIADREDTLYQQDGSWWLGKNIEKDVVLDGRLNWIHYSDHEGFKRVYALMGFTQSTYAPCIITKYNGQSKVGLPYYSEKPDEFHLNRNGGLYMFLSNSDTGWLESMAPPPTIVKAYFNGWKYTGNGTTHSWVSLVDGTNAPTNTPAYVSTNRAPNYKTNMMSYALTTQEIINVTDKVEGDLVVSGLTQVSVGSGFTYTTDANTGKRTYTMIPANGRYKTTCNATEVSMTIAKNIRTSLEETLKKQSDIATEVTIHARSIIDLYAKIKAMEV